MNLSSIVPDHIIILEIDWAAKTAKAFQVRKLELLTEATARASYRFCSLDDLAALYGNDMAVPAGAKQLADHHNMVVMLTLGPDSEPVFYPTFHAPDLLDWACQVMAWKQEGKGQISWNWFPDRNAARNWVEDTITRFHPQIGDQAGTVLHDLHVAEGQPPVMGMANRPETQFRKKVA